MEKSALDNLKCGHFIDGKAIYADGGASFENHSPHNNALLQSVPIADKDTVDAAVRAARQAQTGEWTAMSAIDRSEYMIRIADLILKNLDYLASIESLDTGKPISETKQGDILRCADNFRFFAEMVRHEHGEVYIDKAGNKHLTSKMPLGVVGLITPWNLPLYLATWKIAPAMAMGNSIVLKPAELTPMSAFAFAQLTQEAGIPDGVFNVVQGLGAGSTGQFLVEHPDVNGISFTGETTTGKAIMRTAADSLKKVSFELGGKGASIICGDADLKKACETSLRAGMRNQGQICLAGSRMIVHESVYEKAKSYLIEGCKKIKLGPPLDQKTTMGSLICHDHREKVIKYLKLTSPEQIVYPTENRDTFYLKNPLEGHEEHHDSCSMGAYLQPCIVEVSDNSSPLIQEEIFGPVITLQKFSSLEEALSLLNGTKYGLSCSIWTNSMDTADFLTTKAEMGMIWVNSWFLRDLHTPFGGMKESGVGREGGKYSLNFFAEHKTISYPSPLL